MNMAIRGIDFNFGSKNADTFLENQHPDLRADFVMANPPFNMKDWWNASLADDARWHKHDFVLTPGRYVGAPPQEDDGIPFAEKMADLTAQLKVQLAESATLEEQIKQNLAGLGYEL